MEPIPLNIQVELQKAQADDAFWKLIGLLLAYRDYIENRMLIRMQKIGHKEYDDRSFHLSPDQRVLEAIDELADARFYVGSGPLPEQVEVEIRDAIRGRLM